VLTAVRSPNPRQHGRSAAPARKHPPAPLYQL
jgi:hypothetical protein